VDSLRRRAILDAPQTSQRSARVGGHERAQLRVAGVWCGSALGRHLQEDASQLLYPLYPLHSHHPVLRVPESGPAVYSGTVKVADVMAPLASPLSQRFTAGGGGGGVARQHRQG
jgi:hypothetical protein